MVTITQDSPGHWSARRDDTVVCRAAVVTRPDGRRWFIPEGFVPDAYLPLLAAIPGELYVHVEDAEQDADSIRQQLHAGGFVVYRRENNFLIPTDPARTGLADTPTLAGVSFVDATNADTDRLRHLDDTLRQDVPGTDGWRWEPDDFRAQTFGPDFDPATYLIAACDSTGEYLGLARVWWPEEGPRLGLIGVVAAHRRGGVAKALLARVFAVVHERGRSHVSAEADVTNTASTTLLTALGGRRVGGSRELIRREPTPADDAGPPQ